MVLRRSLFSLFILLNLIGNSFCVLESTYEFTSEGFSSAQELDGLLFLSATEANTVGYHGRNLFRWDGTSQVEKITSFEHDFNPRNFVVVRDQLWFAASTKDNTKDEIWKMYSDGQKPIVQYSEEGLVIENQPWAVSSEGDIYMVAALNGIYSIMRYKTYTNKMEQRTSGNYDPSHLTIMGDYLYFVNGEKGLYRISLVGDESPQLVIDQNTKASQSGEVHLMVELHSLLYYIIGEPGNSELRIFDGDHVVKTIPAKFDDFAWITHCGGKLFICAKAYTGYKIFQFETSIWEDISHINDNQSDDPFEVACVANTLYFSGYSPDSGIEIYQYFGGLEREAVTEVLKPGPKSSLKKNGVFASYMNQVVFPLTSNTSSTVLRKIVPYVATDEPHFVGFRGQRYVIDAVDGIVYSLLSTEDLLINAMFTNMTLKRRPNQVWFNSLGVKTGQNELLVDATEKLIELNGEELAISPKINVLDNDVKIYRDSEFRVMISSTNVQIELFIHPKGHRDCAAGKFECPYIDFAIAVKNMNFWMAARSVADDDMYGEEKWPEHVTAHTQVRLPIHGILGASALVKSDPGPLPYIPGAKEDYKVHFNEIFGEVFNFNVFRGEGEPTVKNDQ